VGGGGWRLWEGGLEVGEKGGGGGGEDEEMRLLQPGGLWFGGAEVLQSWRVCGSKT